MRLLSGGMHRFRPVVGCFFFLLLVCCVVHSAGAATPCGLTKNDCPACPVGGLALTAANAPTYVGAGPEYLDCTYGNPGSAEYVTLNISCYHDRATAQEEYDSHTVNYVAPAHTPSRILSPVSVAGKPSPFQWGQFETAYALQDRSASIIKSYRMALKTEPGTKTEITDRLGVQNRERCQQFTDCFASFKPGGVPASAQQNLKGTIYATSYPTGIPQPLKYSRITLLEEGKKVLGVETDAEGKYEFAYAFHKDKTYRLEIGLAYTRGDKEYFTLYYGEPVESKKVIFRHDFTYKGDADLTQDVNLDDLWKKKSDTINPFGIMYIHFTEAYEFYADYLKEDVYLNLPLKIVAFSSDPAIKKDRARYDSDGLDSYIYISPKESIPESELRPLGLYHEFSHYMMANTYGREPEPVVTGHGNSVNHGGFLNPDTTDSWAEGFANFMAGAIAERTQIAATALGESVEPCDGASYYGALEDNYQPWEYHGTVEEAAVAGTLWDLFDSADQKRACEAQKVTFSNTMLAHPGVVESKKTLIRLYIEAIHVLEQRYGYSDDSGNGYEDKISFTLPELWGVMRTYHPDMLSFYDALQKKYPRNKQQIDDIFLMHGFWKETSPGNGKHDAEEPYRDANGNKAYDANEEYIDLAENLEYSAGEVIGTAADANRTWRRTTQQLPGQFVKVNNNAPYYSYTVEFPGTKRWPYTNYAVNNEGSIFVPVPSDPTARITVKASGVRTGNPLVFTSQQFQQNYETALKQGYYTSHDFQLSGPVPPQPKIPDVAGMGGQGSSGAGRLPDIFSPTSRVPLIIAIPLVIAGILLLVYLVRKES